jgi:hypothetical protein
MSSIEVLRDETGKESGKCSGARDGGVVECISTSEFVASVPKSADRQTHSFPPCYGLGASLPRRQVERDSRCEPGLNDT